jgi:hypothetical protein
MKIITLLFMTILTLAVQAQTVKITDFGAIPDDGISDDQALIAARSKISQFGGTIEFPCGITNLSGEHNFSNSGSYVNWKLRGDQCAIIEVKQLWILFQFGNNPQVIIEGITFVGRQVPPDHPEFTDASQGIIHFGAYQNILRDTKFYGLRSNNYIVRATGNTIIEDCQFDGNSASVANVLVDTQYQKGLTVKRTTFLDYSNFLGQYWSKSPYGNGAWICVTGGVPPGNAHAQRALRIEDSIFDEGATTGIHADNIDFVSIAGSSFNVAGTTPGRGVHFDNVALADLERNFFGYSGLPRPAIVAVNGSKVAVRAIRTGNRVYLGNTDATSKIEEISCIGNCKVNAEIKNK